MWQKNSGQTASEEIQNRFTGYLLSAVRRKKAEYFRKLYLQQEHEISETELLYPLAASELNEWEAFPVLQRLDNAALWRALNSLSDRELYVLLERAVEEKGFDELASELQMGYKGVAAIYYRTIAKVKAIMREVKKK